MDGAIIKILMGMPIDLDLYMYMNITIIIHMEILCY